MKDWHHLEAGYLLNQLWIQISHFADGVIPIVHRSPFFSSTFLLSLGIFIVLLLLARKIYIFIRFHKQKSILLEITPPAIAEKTAYTTKQLFSLIHDLGDHKGIINWFLGRKTLFSFEIVSTRSEGIRYLIRTTLKEENTLRKHLLSYLPQVHITTVDEYLPSKSSKQKELPPKIVAFKLKKHFALPLAKQNTLEEHDPVAYITGMMTQLTPHELIAFQIVLTPVHSKEASRISHMPDIDVLSYITTPQFPWYMKIFVSLIAIIGKLIYHALGFIMTSISEMRWGSDQKTAYAYQYYEQQHEQRLQQFEREKPIRMLNAFEQDTVRSIKAKMNEPLFETSIRVFIALKDKRDQKERIKGFISALANFSVPKYQALGATHNFLPFITDKIRLITFTKRLLSLLSNKSSSLLSVSEIADLYHFPFLRVTQTENIVKIHSKELPTPLSLKNGRKFSIIFGNNTYGGVTTPIGLTKEERKTHMYVIGRTGSGKTTLLFSMAKHDMENGEGMAFIDPHGDVSEDLLASIPDKRINDVIYFNPFDVKYPIGINLLELTPNLDEDEAELEREVVAEGVVSLFRKVFSKDENANAHRIEYILRNTIHTAFTVEDRTIFTIYDLLNNPPFQKQVIAKLTDENLKNFWKFEFGRAGDYQIVKMVGGVTAKIGRFLFSPTAKRILEQKKSTINFNDILDGKILICNLSQGKLGEDTARLLGTTILTKIQQAALKRANIPENKRTQFHLYVDEFQNFATLSFAKMLSEGRKYGLELYIAEQSTSQQQDRSIVNIILTNVTTMISFRSGNPIDEDLMLAQFAPFVQKGEIMNLPRYHFYIKISAIESEDAFSGETIKIAVKKNKKLMEKLIEASRKNYAIPYVKPKENTKKIVTETTEEAADSTKNPTEKTGLPKAKKQ